MVMMMMTTMLIMMLIVMVMMMMIVMLCMIPNGTLTVLHARVGPKGPARAVAAQQSVGTPIRCRSYGCGPC